MIRVMSVELDKLDDESDLKIVKKNSKIKLLRIILDKKKTTI